MVYYIYLFTPSIVTYSHVHCLDYRSIWAPARNGRNWRAKDSLSRECGHNNYADFQITRHQGPKKKFSHRSPTANACSLKGGPAVHQADGDRLPRTTFQPLSHNNSSPSTSHLWLGCSPNKQQLRRNQAEYQTHRPRIQHPSLHTIASFLASRPVFTKNTSHTFEHLRQKSNYTRQKGCLEYQFVAK